MLEVRPHQEVTQILGARKNKAVSLTLTSNFLNDSY